MHNIGENVFQNTAWLYSKPLLIQINWGKRWSVLARQKVADEDKQRRTPTNEKFNDIGGANLVIKYLCINLQKSEYINNAPAEPLFKN